MKKIYIPGIEHTVSAELSTQLKGLGYILLSESDIDPESGTELDILREVDLVLQSSLIREFERHNKDELKEKNILRTRELVDMSLIAEVPLFVFISTSNILQAKSSLQAISSDNVKLMASDDEVLSSILNAELEVWRGQVEGLKTVVINTALLLDENGRYHANRNMIELIDSTKMNALTGRNSFMDLSRMGSIISNIINSENPEERYILSSEGFSWKELKSEFLRKGIISKGSLFKSLIGHLSLTNNRTLKQQSTLFRKEYEFSNDLMHEIPGLSSISKKEVLEILLQLGQ